jgi:electron transport complex protein RnfG
MVLSLSFIALGASAALGVVHKLTEGPIEASKLNKKLQAIKQVVPEFTNNPNEEMFLLATPEGDSMEVYPAKKDSIVLGYALKTWTEKGFSGRISLMTGFKPDGSIYNITVLEHKETPGLGTKMTEPGFKDQFNGKNPGEEPLKVKKDGGKVDAITAATISSRAFCDAVTRAHSTLMKKQDK